LLDSCRNYLLLVANQELDPALRAKVSPMDLVQETFLRAHNAFDRFTGDTEAELLAWLRRILINHLLNVREQFQGTQRRDVHRELSLQGGELPAGEHSEPRRWSTPLRGLVAQEEIASLQRALSRLPEHYQEVIRLRHFEERGFPEIGAAMGRAPDAVRMLWVRAIERLRQELERTHE
jgi:RNA polymerase sigma-70 factor (ECF subfamily)